MCTYHHQSSEGIVDGVDGVTSNSGVAQVAWDVVVVIVVEKGRTCHWSDIQSRAGRELYNILTI